MYDSNGKGEERRGNELSRGRPREGLSEMFKAEGTYKDEMWRELLDSRCVILCKMAFCLGLRDFPPLIASITP